MECLFNSLFQVLECPNIKIKKPSWLKQPAPMTVFAFLLVTYFLVTGGKKFNIYFKTNKVVCKLINDLVLFLFVCNEIKALFMM